MTSLMIYGTTSSAGKSLIATGLCRFFSNKGYTVSPFKSQNMSRYYYALENGKKISSAQYIQALAARSKIDSRINPLLLVPKTDIGSAVYFMGEKVSDMVARDYFAYKKELKEDISKIYYSLKEENDVMIIEGAGSPAEINLMENDIVNTGMANIAKTNCVLVVDIDRGGAFAHLYGTVMILPEEDRSRIKGFVINKFRGDASFLDSGILMIEKLTGIPVLGIVPYGNYDLPEEDSLGGENTVKSFDLDKIDREIEKLSVDLEKYLDMDKILEIMNL
jgi:adenosylcobyric acid synthase